MTDLQELESRQAGEGWSKKNVQARLRKQDARHAHKTRNALCRASQGEIGCRIDHLRFCAEPEDF